MRNSSADCELWNKHSGRAARLNNERALDQSLSLNFIEHPFGYSVPCRIVALRAVPINHRARAKSNKNSKASRIETGERSGGIGEICSVEVDEK
jgi:hypothetical protein